AARLVPPSSLSVAFMFEFACHSTDMPSRQAFRSKQITSMLASNVAAREPEPRDERARAADQCVARSRRSPGLPGTRDRDCTRRTRAGLFGAASPLPHDRAYRLALAADGRTRS